MEYIKKGFQDKGTGTTYRFEPPEPTDKTNGGITKRDLNRIRKDGFSNRTKKKKLFVTFTDDDCRIETYNKLFPVLKETGITALLACPFDQLGTDKYMNKNQLQEMRNIGCEVSSHYLKQYAMNQFTTLEKYEAELKTCDKRMKALNISEQYVCYPNGIYVMNYMRSTQNHYDVGFTVDRGINKLPLASYFLKRVEVFPTTGFYDLAFVKTYVDSLEKEEVGWLVFMTHSWYSTFNATDLKELINYIKAKGTIEIVSVTDALKQIGNVVECGVMVKPIEYNKEPFYTVDAFGRVYANSEKVVTQSKKELVTVEGSGFNVGYNLTAKGATPTVTDKKRVVSSKFTVAEGEEYIVSASNVYENALYCIYDSSGTVIANKLSANSATGTVIEGEKVTIPTGGVGMRIASNMNIQNSMYSVFKLV